MGEVYFKNSFFKTSGGTIHRVLADSCTVDCYCRPDSLIKECMVTRALPYSAVMSHFGVDSSTVKSHGTGRITEDSLLRIML